MLRNRRQSQRVKLTFSAPQLWCRSCTCLLKQTGHRKVGISVPDLSEANVNDKSSRTDLYYTTTTSFLPTALHTLHIKSTHLLTVEALHLSDASSCEPQLQALAAAHLLQELLDPLHRPRPAQQRLRPPGSSQRLEYLQAGPETFLRKKGESASPLYCVCQYTFRTSCQYTATYE